MWHVTGYRWQVTGDRWHVTCCRGWTLFENFSNLALTFCIHDILKIWRKRMTQLMNQCTVQKLVADPTFLHIINLNKWYGLHIQNKILKICVVTVVKMHTKNYKSRNISRNRSSPEDTTNIQTQIFQPDEVRMTFSHFSVKVCRIVLHPQKCGYALLSIYLSIFDIFWWLNTMAKSTGTHVVKVSSAQLVQCSPHWLDQAADLPSYLAVLILLSPHFEDVPGEYLEPNPWPPSCLLF